MDQDRARSLLIAERDEVQGLLKDAETAGQDDRQAEVDSEAEDEADAALALTEEGQDDAIAESLRSRLDAIERALRRLDDGTYGRSVRSGAADPRRAPRSGPRRGAHHRGSQGRRTRLTAFGGAADPRSRRRPDRASAPRTGPSQTPNDMNPAFHGVRTHWIPGFMRLRRCFDPR